MSAESLKMEKIVSLCKRRGFVFPASEIYGGLNGFWDYGPLGVELKNNLRDAWWNDMVHHPPAGPDGQSLDIVGVDSAIIQNPQVWEASGHVGGFNDPMVDDRETKARYRADHLTLYGIHSNETNERVGPCFVAEADFEHASDDELIEPHKKAIGQIIRKNNLEATGYSVVRVAGGISDDALRAESIAPGAKERGTLTEPRQFNLMFRTFVGAMSGEDNVAYLRPETAQGIFTNYKNVLDTMRIKVPFGIAQIGKSFRNEVTPRNYVFRSREFEQMEMEWFCHPDEARKWYDFWVEARKTWWASLGVSQQNLQTREHGQDELAHYSTACADVEYRYPFTDPGFGELEGISHRGCFDLSQHQDHAKTKLEYFDQERNERYIPHVIEPAAGLTRGLLVLLCEAYRYDDSRASKEFMLFHPRLAPIKAAVFPLVAKDGLPDVAEPIYRELGKHYTCQYDTKQAIGKRYARMDEAGTPFCFTIDGQTKEDGTVTVRHRDDASQLRIDKSRCLEFLRDKLQL
ncbi:MAG: glycine--tRNA ligase [Planctomycetota bacterium]|jgi:glycyl-tRNA synthetase